MMHIRIRFALVCATICLAACEYITEQPAQVGMGATLTGSRVRPDSVETTGGGTLSATLYSTPRLEYTIEFSGLSGAANAAHIHGPADTNAIANVLVDLAALPTGNTGSIALGAAEGSGSGSIDLSLPVTATVSGDSLHALLRDGLLYVDVHTATHGAGEIRGQLRRR